MGSDQEAHSRASADVQEGQKQYNEAKPSTDTASEQRPSLAPRSSMESRATTLPSYREQADQPPRYSSTSTRPRPSAQNPEPRAPASSSGVSAAAISAVMATSSSEHDKMHSKGTKKVDDWNKDNTYKGKLARMTGSSGKWNYFGADVGENPFKRFGRKR